MAKGDGEATFTLTLKEEGAEGAKLLADNVEEAGEQVVEAMAELRKMEAALRNLKRGGGDTAATFDKMNTRVKEQRGAVAKMQAGYLHMGGTFKATRKEAVSSAVEQVTASKQASAAQAAWSLKVKQGAVVSAALVSGMMAIAAAAGAVAAALGVATAALVKYGLASADARRSELLRLEGMTKIRRFWGMGFGAMRAPEDAGELQSVIDQVSAKTALGREKLIEYTSSLHKMGLRGQGLRDTLEGMAITGAVQGDKWAQVFKSMAMGAALTGTSIKALTEDVRARLGGIAERQLLSLDVQARKLKENVALLFKDVKIEGFLKALNAINVQLSQQTVTGRTLRDLFTRMFKPLEDLGKGDLGKVVTGVIQGIVLGAMRVELAFLRTKKAIEAAFGIKGVSVNLDLISLSANVASVAVQALAAAVGGLVLSFAVLGAQIAIVLAPFMMLGSVALMVYDMITRPKWDGIGMKIIDGIIQGLRDGVRKLAREAGNVGDTIMTAIRGALGIASPSRIMRFQVGRNISLGIVQGIRDEMPRVESTMRHVIAPPTPIAMARGGGSRSATVNFEPGSIVVHGDAGASGDDLATRVIAAVEEMLERALIQMGGEEAA